jgi:glucosamine-6-phosphate deaminase
MFASAWENTKMEVIILKNADEVAKLGADLCVKLLREKPDSVLGLATGSTPLSLYEELVGRFQKKEISFKKVKTFNLDEYVGLNDSHPQSYRYYMNENFFKKIDIDKSNTHIPDASSNDFLEAGRTYEKLIAQKGGIDLQILGIGRNGHIGFNEPTSSLSSRTRIKTLTEATIRDNSRFFDSEEFQPGLGITMGIATILETRKILLLATGENKAEAIASAVEGPLTSMCPASALQLHPHVTVIVDERAGMELKQKSYYEWVYSQKLKLEKR